MGGREEHLAVKAHPGPHLWGEAAHAVAGQAGLPKQAAGIAQGVQKLPVPGFGAGVHQAGGGGVGVLVLHLAGEAVGQVLRHHQQALGFFQ